MGAIESSRLMKTLHPRHRGRRAPIGQGCMRAVAIMLLALGSACGGGDSDPGSNASDPSLTALCTWLQQVATSAVPGDVTEETIQQIGADAGRLVNEASGLSLPPGEMEASVDNAVQLLDFIEDASGRDAAIDTVSTYREILTERLATLLVVIRRTYSIPADQAPCAGFEIATSDAPNGRRPAY